MPLDSTFKPIGKDTVRAIGLNTTDASTGVVR